MPNAEIEKGKVHKLGEIIEYAPDSVVSKTIFKKTTGVVQLVSYDTGKGLTGTIYPFDIFLLLLEGKAEIKLNGSQTLLAAFEGLIIPAHASYSIIAIERFKLLSVMVKSGYE